MEISRVGEFTLTWGESVVWDDRRRRLYFVDCGRSTLHWLDPGSERPVTLPLPSMPTGVVPTHDDRLVVALDDGLNVVDPDHGTAELFAPYPEAMGGRANDACADLDGNLVTGKLNTEVAEGSAWWFSSRDGWRLLDPDISNTNGPTVGMIGGALTLVIGDTGASYFAYPYDPSAGTVGERQIFGAVDDLDGIPDGATLDDGGGLWCALVGGGQLARFTADGLDRTVALPTPNVTDVTFGGPDLDRLYVVSVSGDGALDGALLAVDGLGHRGRPEPRFRLG